MATTAKELKELMLQIGMDKALVEGLDTTQPLAKQEVDSVDYPSFSLAVEEKYGVKISEADSMRLKSINDFVAFVRLCLNYVL